MPAVRPRPRRFACLQVEQLEQRLTPTGNIAITNAFLVNSSGQALSVVNVGERVFVEVDFTTQNLPSNASYRIAFTVNGLTLDTGNLTYAAGSSGTNYWYEYWGNFVATSGTNQVSVNVDVDKSVPETTYADNTTSFAVTAVSPAVGSLTYTVAQIRQAYGISSIPNFGSAAADGSGQTIAIVDAFNDPNIISDLDGFDQGMSLTTNSTESMYQQYGPASSILSVYNQAGVNITSSISNSGANAVPPVDSTGDWEGEETLDVEWGHAIAPGAHIDLIETTGSGSFYGLYVGAATAAQLPGVTAVSMSWIWAEGNWSSSNGSGELAYDSSTFVTPSGHSRITFLAASGDGGTPGGSPAFSPNVVAVGGTQLSVNNNAYGSETAWSFPTPRTLNSGSASYSQTGSWTAQSGGFSGTYNTATAASSSSATWTTSISSSDQGWVGGTEVSTTWTASPGNATNATYKIYDGTAASGTLLGTVHVDQTMAPVGTSDGSAQFQELGDFYPRSGTVTVVLTANTANGAVVADAIGIAPAWATGGAQSQYESEPSYQLAIQNTGYRTSPDVSFDGSINSGVTCYQSGGFYYGYAGTSLACPCWAGLIAIADQGRAQLTIGTLDGASQTLPAIYSMPESDFHDITSGYNGHSATVGYDLTTGLGSPIAPLVVGALVTYGTSAPAITAQPSNQTAGAGLPATFTAAASGYPTPSVQWQISVNNGPFTNISGATSDSYTTPPTTPADDGDRYQAVFTNGIGSPVTTNIATLTVDYVPVVTTEPASQTVTVGQTVTFTAAATSDPAPTVKWQFTTDGTTFTDIAGATGTTYTFNPVPSDNGKQFRAVFTNSVGTVDSNTALLTVVAPVTVASVQVGDGTAQRSEVRSLTVTFSGAVTFAGGNIAAAFQLNQVQDSNNVVLAAAVSTNSSGQTVITLTFSGAETDAESAENPQKLSPAPLPSLADGRYTLTITSASVTDANGAALDGLGTGTAGSGNYVSPTDTLGGGAAELGLYRLFGDSLGDGIDDQLALAVFRSAFNSSMGNSSYVAYLDADNSGTIDQIDLAQFRGRFNSSVFPSTPSATPLMVPAPPPAAPVPPTLAPLPLALAPVAATVPLVAVNDGSTLRSTVRLITVAFSAPITFTSGDANGDGVVDQNDLGLSGSIMNASAGDASYLSFLDAVL